MPSGRRPVARRRMGEVSRSRRKTPVTGVTTAPSEKQDKRAYNRRYRRASRQVVRGTGELAGEQKPLPRLREHSNPWDMGKDGKMLFDPREKPGLRAQQARFLARKEKRRAEM